MFLVTSALRVRKSLSLVFAVVSASLLIGASTVSLQAQQFSPTGPLSFTKVFNGANPLPQTLTVTSTGANFNFSYAATTNTGGTWLSVDNVSFNGCGLCGMPQNINVIVNATATLAPGTYTGQIVLTSQSGLVTMTVPVSLTVAALGSTFFDNLPGQVSFSLQSGGLAPPSQPIQIRNGGTGTLNWTLSTSTVDGGAWLSASATSGTAPSTVNISLNKANLPGQGITAGTFLGKLVFQSANGNVTVPVSVTVGNNVFRQVNAISFTRPFNSANPLPQILDAFTTDSTVALQMTASASTGNGGAWLTVDNVSFNACGLCATPQSFRVNVVAGPTMAIGTYTGQVAFTSRDGTQALTIPVILTITPPSVPFFANLPGLASFSLATNGLAPPNQEIDIRNGGTSGMLDWTVTAITADGGSWLTVSPSGGTAPSAVSVGISVPNLPNGGLLPGNFVGELIFQSANGNVTVPISVVVGANVFRQVNAISFTKPVNGANPLPQTITAASTGTDFQFTASVSTAIGGAWLSIDNVSFNNCGLCSTPQNFQVIVNAPPTMAIGTYTGQVIFIARDGSQTLVVPVTLTIADPTAGAFFDNLPGQVSFSMVTSGGTPPGQTVQIRNAGSGTLSWTLDTSTADGGNWLNVSVTSGTAPSLVKITINPLNLPGQGLIGGTFVGQLVFRTAGENVTIPVTVAVGANAFQQVNAISFTKPVAGANPLPQTLTIASTGTDFQFTFSSSTATGGSWLSLTNASFNACGLCSTPQNLTATVNASVTMPVGTYTGEIVVTARDGTQNMVVPVTLTVGDPAAGPLFDNLPGQMTFSLQTGGGAPPSQAVQIRNAGTGTLNWTLETSTSDGGNWLNVSVLNGTAPSVVTVSINKQNLPNQSLIGGTFEGELVFRSGNQSITVPVSVTVGDNVFRQVNAISFVKPVGPGNNPLPQTLTIASTGTELAFTFSGATATGGSWLTVDNVSFNDCALCATPLALTARVNAAATMAVGTYTGQIVITARDSTQTLTVPVTLTVADPASTPFFDNIPGQMSFSMTTGSGNPASRTIDVRNAGTGILNWAVSGTTADGAAWLTLGPTTGSNTINAPTTVTVGVVANSLPGQGLVPGVFTGEIVFLSAGSSVTVPVSVRVNPNVFVQRPTLTFATPNNTTNPVPQGLNIASTGTALQFTVTSATGAGGNWLSVTTPAGCALCATPAGLTVNINAAGLAVGFYTGQIVITARDSTEAMTVPVILTVGTPPPPAATITSVTPNSGQVGQTLANVALVGLNTHFLQGTTVASFGAGITINSLTVNSATSATASITIQAGATLGTRTVTLTTGSEVAPLANGFTVVGAAVITSVTPNTGQVGNTLASVAIVGQNTNFVQGTTVASFGAGITVNSLTVNSATSATANITIQAGATPGARTVTLTTGSQVATLANGFTVIGAAVISSVTPNSGSIGQTLANVAIVGQNTNFVQGTTVASFGAGITINSLTVNSATSATANITIQAGATPGTRTVTLTTGSEVATLANGFTVIGAEVITSVTPNSGQVGNTLASVAIVGQNTNFVQGTTVASFGAGITINSLTVNSATSATANITIQAGATPGARTVTLTTGSQVATLASGFTVIGAAVITSVTPNSGQVGNTLASVAIVGQNTNFVQGTTVASFGAGITINSLTVNSATSATASITIQAGATAGSRTVTLTTGSQVATLANGFTVIGAAVITSVTPNSGQVGNTLASVAIVGQNTNFVQGTTVASFGAGITINSLTVNSATSATANISIQAGATAGARTVTLTTGSEVAVLANGFTVIGAAVITSVTPNSGQVGNTLASVAIVGQNTNFVQGTTVASLGAGITVNSLTVNSATSATANITIQAGATPGARTVILTTGSQVATLASGFTVIGAAVITSVTPNSGQVGNTLASVAIVGQNTNFVQGTTVASFGAGITINSLTVNSATSATANITIQAAATPGARTVTLTTGSEVAVLANGFTVIGAAVITSVTPNSGQVGNTLASVAIVGQNTSFVQGTTVANFGAGITVNSLTVNSATSATASITIQGGATPGTRTVTLTTGSQVATLANGFTVIGAAVITSVTPNSGQVGNTLASVAIVGQNTNFVQGTTVASFGAGITINSLTVNSATSATANITIQAAATPGARTVTLTTGSEVAVLANGFTLIGAAVITSVTPNSGQVGNTLASVAIVGQNTNFVQGTTVASFGAGITINSLTVNSGTSATANITIQAGATTGVRTVTLTTGSQVAVVANGFTVIGAAVITSVTPNSGQVGNTLANVAIVGQNTNFVQGTTAASFGAGITINSLTVNSATSAMANISIQAGATAGARTVTLTTGSEVAVLANGFTVIGAAVLTSVTPNSGQVGNTLASVAIVGQNTNFVQGTTVANFGAGITINSLTVNSVTNATANITIQAGATPGARTVTLTTGSQVAVLANGFTVIGAAVITSVTPNSGQVGNTLASVAIVGQNTNFLQGTTAANFGAGITVNSLTVNSATSATANITIQAGATPGARTVTLTTGSEVAVLASGFTVIGAAVITSVAPNTGQVGNTLANVAIVGQNTNFVQGTTVASFGAGITINSLTVNSATSVTANITIQAGATPGARTITLTTGSQVATLANGFTVIGAAVITSVTANSGQVGNTLANVAISGQNTHFVQGTTVASFGAGVTVNSLTVNSATSATASITIQAGATPGARTVTLTTGSEVAVLANGFTVIGAAALTSVTPNSGQGGQTLTNVAIVGQNTNFVQGTTVANFGTGITINSLTVISLTSATANITIQAGTPSGARTVTLTTGTEVATLANGFTVAAPLDVLSFSVLFGSQSYNVSAAGNTRVRLPWQITGIRVVFSQAVTGGNVNSLGGLTPTGFSGLGTNTLTWSINPLALGSVVAALSGSGPNALTGASGATLGAGSGYMRSLSILLGDFNDDGVVSSADLVGVNNATTTAFNLFADMNGDGTVNLSDVQVVRSRIGTSLP